ncbi:TetR/AcrR family transcriptional regulator [Cryobacterium sp. PH29-G1]|uniref:TetR/AcrR family transcriptional regulator n=1 Tax=Cryobacterium sp. PH29-G1 TaxID=3046211 RepID=UPI0024BB4DCB|nr:TetR/AcrR family transcriptional regulator [Cryobacterium sp. PH29-G1]MDJ0350453.1 TetR/AcrR family transcriptional regulator [Cryobacterium sp. PH29-G1]
MLETKVKPTLRERRFQRTRQELVDAVLAAVGEYGIEGVTIDRVAEHAGLSRGTIYAHYPAGRDELLRAAYAALGHDVAARTRARVLEAGSWQARLVAHASVMYELARVERIGYFFNVSGPALIPEGEERGIGSSASVALMRETLVAAREEGTLAADVPPDSIAILLVGAVREAAAAVASGACDASEAEEGFARLVEGLAAGVR